MTTLHVDEAVCNEFTKVCLFVGTGLLPQYGYNAPRR